MTSRFPNVPLQDEQGNLPLPWAQTFTLWAAAVQSVRDAGPMLQRPTSGLWVGRSYFDTTLGYPVWVKRVAPTVQWVNAIGAVV